MSDEPRKASNILLSLEEKVNTLIKIVSVYDMNTKIILNRVNKVYAYIEMLEREMVENDAPKHLTAASQLGEPEPVNEELVETSAEHVITMTDKPMGHRRTPRAETYVSEVLPAVPVPVSAQEPEVRHAKADNERKVPVTQRVTWQDASGTVKDLFMAEVSIFNDQKELVTKTKTNAAGKWQAYIKPGMYSVNVSKTDTATKKKLEALQDIHVEDSKTTVVIPTAIVKK